MFFPPKNIKKVKQSNTEGLELQSLCRDPNLLINNSQFNLILIITTWFAWVLLLFILIFFLFFVFFLSPPHPPPMAYMTWWWWVGWLVYRGIFLYGLPTQQISRQQGVNGGGASNHTGVLSAWRSPQAGVLRHTAPQQVASAGFATTTTTAPLANWVGLCRPTHPVLMGSWVGLPASGVCP